MKLPVDYETLTATDRRLVREEYVRLQGGKCWHCKKSLLMSPTKEILNMKIDWSKFPNGFRNNPVHLHHDHESGMTIGAVHAYCNAVLWQYYGS